MSQTNPQCDTACGTDEKCKGCAHNQAEQQKPPLPHRIGKVIAVCSGKGGVGKSTVSATLAVALSRQGLRVGILDADITGPSIPHLFGITQKASGDGTHMHPVKTQGGISVMSINLLLESDDTPVIWRGPMIASVVGQFWTDVAWGELDVLVVDMPPGTGDVPLTVFQSIPVDGIIVVATPQDLVTMIVKKAVNMARNMNVPVLGLVENMAYATCPHCGEKHSLFGGADTQSLAASLGTRLIASLPLQSTTTALCDAGRIEDLNDPQADALGLTTALLADVPLSPKQK